MTVIVKELILGIVNILPAIVRAFRRKSEKRKDDALAAQKRKNAGEESTDCGDGNGARERKHA